MAETIYPNNSDRAQSQNAADSSKHLTDKHVSQVTSGNVTRMERSLVDKAREFFGLDELHSFRDYVSCLSDITNRIYSAVDILLGNKRGSSGYSTPGAKIAYSQQYQPQQNNGNARQRTASNYSYDDLLFDTRGDAEITLAKMWELLETYKAVSIADMFDLAGVTSPNGYIDNKYGWTEQTLSGARVIHVRDGFMLDLPRAEQL